MGRSIMSGMGKSIRSSVSRSRSRGRCRRKTGRRARGEGIKRSRMSSMSGRGPRRESPRMGKVLVRASTPVTSGLPGFF